MLRTVPQRREYALLRIASTMVEERREAVMDMELFIFLVLVVVFAGGAGLVIGGARWIVSHLVGFADEGHAHRLARALGKPASKETQMQGLRKGLILTSAGAALMLAGYYGLNAFTASEKEARQPSAQLPDSF